MDNNLIVSTSPHLRSGARTRRIMLDVLIALAPAAVAAVVFFGLHAFLMMAVSVATAVLSEYIYNRIVKKEQTVGDLSAVVTGLLLALTLRTPSVAQGATQKEALITLGVFYFQIAVGAVFAIIVVKCLFGGIGCNFANPAITARVMMLIAFGSSFAGGSATAFGKLTDYTKPDGTLITGATPLGVLNGGGSTEGLPPILDMLIGNRGGAIGETCVIALLIGFVYLLVRRVITWHTPVVFIGSTFFLSLIFSGFNINVSLYHLFGGGLFLCAIFMATDYVTSPIYKWGKVIFAFGCALITVIIRFLADLPEGVSYALLIMNILSPYIELITAPKPLGAAKKQKKEDNA